MRRNGIIINCKYCGKERYVQPSLLKQNRGSYCSVSCARKDHKPIWLIESRKTDKYKKAARAAKLKLYADETKHPRWKGDKVGYYGVHDWITKHYGQPKKCQECGLDDENRKYHWANISLNYIRDIKDWKRLCVSCHRKYDYSRPFRKLPSKP
jgi:hypothetical protein